MTTAVLLLVFLGVFASYAAGHRRGRRAGWTLARRFPCVRELSSLER